MKMRFVFRPATEHIILSNDKDLVQLGGVQWNRNTEICTKRIKGQLVHQIIEDDLKVIYLPQYLWNIWASIENLCPVNQNGKIIQISDLTKAQSMKREILLHRWGYVFLKAYLDTNPGINHRSFPFNTPNFRLNLPLVKFEYNKLELIREVLRFENLAAREKDEEWIEKESWKTWSACVLEEAQRNIDSVFGTDKISKKQLSKLYRNNIGNLKKGKLDIYYNRIPELSRVYNSVFQKLEQREPGWIQLSNAWDDHLKLMSTWRTHCDRSAVLQALYIDPTDQNTLWASGKSRPRKITP